MKTKYFIFFICVFLCLGWADNWEGIKKSAGIISSVQADFIQEKHMKILSKPLISKGTFCYQSPESLRWEYLSPVQSVLLMHKGKTKRFIKTGEDYVEDSGANLQAMQIVLQEITRWLKGEFDKNPDFEAGLESKDGRSKIVLIPRQKAFASIINKIELILADQPGVIDMVMIYENQDSYTKLVFKNSLLNKAIDESRFKEI
ncbi:Outer membrane lipoprotein carrier protein, LolA-related [Desulfonema limicola]|uniref:Outer membrane lipoprotein carrier protein, LolA-related n=1 Tax=Desulfonema limicola TaxID=45656 RepID=A0A975B5Q7_9BACT|nr:outer membrane lipoprotein carrier protein LolA [Desulfonema limicola]QTA79285.1 Outer membrane lipoprotein carrier protein, LolA-related [Desulfonema limicola]